MNFLENDLEKIIYETPNKILNERGLPINGIKKQQFNIGSYGRCDIITLQKATYNKGFKFHEYGYKFKIQIFELKKDNISPSTFFQILHYAKGVNQYLINIKGFRRHDFVLELIMIGKDLTQNSSFIYLPDFFMVSDYFRVRNFLYDYSIDGITFKEIKNYALIEEGFKNN